MLADDRAEALVNNFAAQWLYLRNLNSTQPDSRLFPDFDDNLRQAFRRETELLFESVMKENRSVLDLLRADYTFLNERLAKHYGIPNVYGSHFRRVELGPDHVRGGLLGQGSIMTVTSYANRTSPVRRGKWILENLLGTPVPPPPLNVPPLPENNPGAKVLTMRERMVQHRANAVCASCHQLMDPVGLATENFDAIGRYRTQSEAGGPVDASGGLPDGSSFDGAIGLRKAVMNRPELFVNTLTEKLMTYALGRGLEYYDAPAVRDITRHARADDYRFSSVVLGIVNSTPFKDERRSAAHDHHQTGLAAADVSPWARRDAGAPRARCHGAGVRRPECGGRASPAARRGLHPDGVEHRRVDAEAGGDAHGAVADALAADAALEARQRAQQPRDEERLLLGEPRHRELHVPERREGEDDRRLGLRDGRHGRSNHRAADRQGNGAALARAGNRLQLRGRQLRQRVQLRLHEHAGVVVEDDPAADRGEPASRIRAALRRRRVSRRPQGRAPQERQHSRLGHRGHGASRTPPGPVGPHASRRVSRYAARGRAAHSDGPSSRTARRCPRC